MRRLRISEIFLSLQGETRTSGFPTVFVRLTGCPLRCGYCDTQYAFKGGDWMDMKSVLARVANYGTYYVTVTGGEPLAQQHCLELLGALCDAGHGVSLETSGALDIAEVDPRVSTVLDFKTPGSGELRRNLYTNIVHLHTHDQVKFVLCDNRDYEWAKATMIEYQLPERCEVLFSPVMDRLAPRDLAEWILRDRLPVRFQIQLHKLLWGEQPGR